METLSRWICSRIAELILRAELAEGSGSEASKQECVELILRLWSQRDSWPGGNPLSNVNKLCSMLSQAEKQHSRRTLKKSSYLWIKGELDELAEEESKMILDLLGLDIEWEQEQLYLENHRNQLDEEEIRASELLLAWRAQLSPALYQGEPNIVQLPEPERRQAIIRFLRENQEKRAAAIDLFESSASEEVGSESTHNE